jgi:hypothetical protein
MASLEDDEPEIGIDLPEMVVIDGRAGIERETLDRLSHCLQL